MTDREILRWKSIKNTTLSERGSQNPLFSLVAGRPLSSCLRNQADTCVGAAEGVRRRSWPAVGEHERVCGMSRRAGLAPGALRCSQPEKFGSVFSLQPAEGIHSYIPEGNHNSKQSPENRASDKTTLSTHVRTYTKSLTNTSIHRQKLADASSEDKCTSRTVSPEKDDQIQI